MKLIQLSSITALSVAFACAAPVTSTPEATGGATSATGGATAATGGATTATGGATAATGGTTGSTDVECSGSGWSVSNGYVDNGTWCGYAFTADWGTASVTPDEFGSETGDELCASGSIPAEDPVEEVYPGFMIGFAVKSDGDVDQTWSASGTSGVSFDIVVAGASAEAGAIRIMVKTTDGPSDGYSYWLPAGTGSGTISADWSDLTDMPWDPGAGEAMSASDEVEQVGVQIGGREDGPQTISNFCITGASVN